MFDNSLDKILLLQSDSMRGAELMVAAVDLSLRPTLLPQPIE